MSMADTPDGRLDWLLGDFARSTPGVEHALVVSGDGLKLAATAPVGTDTAERLAAITSGLISLAGGAAAMFAAAPVCQTIIEMAGGYFFITSISEGSALAVFAGRRCDMGLIGYEMTALVARVGHVLTPAPRPGVGPDLFKGVS